MVLYCLLSGALTPVLANEAYAEGWAALIRAEIASSARSPRLSDYAPDFDRAGAYEIQRALLRPELKHGAIGGYKGEFLAIDAAPGATPIEPLTGVLLAGSRHSDHAIIRLDGFRRPVLKIEIGFVLRSAIRRPMKSIEDLRTYIRHAVPVVELADPYFSDTDQPSPLDRIATNLGAAAWLTGEAFALSDLTTAEERGVALLRDGNLVSRSPSPGPRLAQLTRLLGMVNHLYAGGWPLEPGCVLITGALAGATLASPGRYEADYGLQSGLSFVLTGPVGGGRGELSVQRR